MEMKIEMLVDFSIEIIIMLLGQSSIQQISSKLWNNAHDLGDHPPFLFEVIGTIKYFHSISVFFPFFGMISSFKFY